MAVESEDDKIMYAFGAALASQTDQFKKVSRKKHCINEKVVKLLHTWDR